MISTDVKNDITRRLLLTSAASTTLMSLAGCASSFGSSHDSDDDSHDEHEEDGDTDHQGHDVTVPDGPSGSATVSMETQDGQSHYDPHIVWVESGGTVTFETESGHHTATAYHPENDSPNRVPKDASAWDSGTVTADDDPYERTFEVTGIHDFFCKPHQAQGMIGTVIVGEPGHAEQPGLAAPQEDLSEDAQSKIQSLNDAVLEKIDSHN